MVSLLSFVLLHVRYLNDEFACVHSGLGIQFRRTHCRSHRARRLRSLLWPWHPTVHVYVCSPLCPKIQFLTPALAYFYTKNEMGMRMAYWFGFAAVAGAFGGLIAFGVQHAHAAVADWRLLFIIEVCLHLSSPSLMAIFILFHLEIGNTGCPDGYHRHCFPTGQAGDDKVP